MNLSGKSKVLISIVAIVIVQACGKNSVQNFSAGDIKNKPEQTIVNISVGFADSTFKKADLFADSGFTYSAAMITLLKNNVKVYFYSKESQKRISVLTADSTIIEDNTKDMTAYGNVVVKSDSSATELQTQKLQWNNKERKLFSKEFVKITSPREVIQGYGFESDEKLTYYKIYKVIGEQK